MISFFPEPYPDELFYSVCARYHERMGYRTHEATSRDLFGSNMSKVAYDLPCNLGSLISVLPYGHQYTVDRLIDDHTVLAFYGPFMPPSRLKTLREDMRSDKGGAVHGRLGILTSGIEVEYFRFCPKCVEADRSVMKETYWHRLHHLPGVEVCHGHKLFLEDSDIRVRRGSKHDEYITAEKIFNSTAAKLINESEREHQILLRIAEDAAWLLSNPGLEEDVEANRERYMGLLIDRGFSNYNRAKVSKIAEAIVEFYPQELLEKLGCGLGYKYNWVKRLVHNTTRAQHPLQHLLFIQFLGITAAKFFKASAKRLPFGEGPWPCLNRASDHFRQDVITEYELSFTNEGHSPRGTFRCGCGFSYYRVGVDRSNDAHLRMNGHETLGKVWEDKLVELYKEGKYTRRQLADLLGISPGNIYKHLALLGLVESRTYKASAESGVPVSSEGKKTSSRKAGDNISETHRFLWLAARAENPEAGRAELRKKISRTYDWLEKYDRAWLERHLPAPRKHKGPPRRINWPERDREIEKQIRDEAERMFHAPGRPIWVSSTSLARRVGKLALLSKRSELLPVSMQVLKELAESAEDYAIRRINWAADVYRIERIYPSRWDLQARAAVSNKMMRRPNVSSFMEAAILDLRQCLE